MSFHELQPRNAKGSPMAGAWKADTHRGTSAAPEPPVTDLSDPQCMTEHQWQVLCAIRRLSRVSSEDLGGYELHGDSLFRTEDEHQFSIELQHLGAPGEGERELAAVWRKDDLPHRVGGPAIASDRSTQYLQDGLLHNEAGPALFMGGEARYALRGKTLSRTQWLSQVRRENEPAAPVAASGGSVAALERALGGGVSERSPSLWLGSYETYAVQRGGEAQQFAVLTKSEAGSIGRGNIEEWWANLPPDEVAEELNLTERQRLVMHDNTEALDEHYPGGSDAFFDENLKRDLGTWVTLGHDERVDLEDGTVAFRID